MLLDIHGIITIALPDTPPGQRVRRHFAHCELRSNEAGAPCDLELRPFAAAGLPADIFDNIKSPYAATLQRNQQGCFVIYPPATPPCLVLELGETLVLHYPEKHSGGNKLLKAVWDALHLAALRKGGCIVKGAAVARDDNCMAIVGPSGSGKTSLLLGFLDAGWDYLGNDKFLYHRGKAYLLEPKFICHRFHIEEFPWMFMDETGHTPLPSSLRGIGRLRRTAIRKLPPLLWKSHRVRQLFDPFITVDAASLKEGRSFRMLDSATVSHWLLLGRSDALRLEPVPLPRAASFISQINTITYDDISRIRLEAALQGESLPLQDSDILTDLSGTAFLASLSPAEHGVLLHQKVFETLREHTELPLQPPQKADSLSVSLVIPTYNRPHDLDACLRSVLMQTHLPDEVLVVDDGDLQDLPLRGRFQELGVELVYLKKERPGLTESRNLAAAKARCELVFYLDDDVVLYPNYVEEILRAYHEGGEDVLAVGGIITNPKPMTLARTLRYCFDVLVCNRGLREGRVLPSGFCTDYNTTLFPVRQTREADFLDGGVSSFRRSLFQDMQFTNRYREYGLGEDKDFSHAVTRRGKVLVTPRARLYHYESPSMRPDKRAWGRKFVLGRYLFFRDHVKRSWKNSICFWYAVAGYSLARTIIAACSMKKSEFARLAGIAEAVAAIASGSMKRALREEEGS